MNRKDTLENINLISGTDAKKCMKCGKCSGRCPAYHDMDVKPHQFVSYLVSGKLEKLLESKAVFTCLSCMACVERCPRGVEPAKLIEALRLMVIREKGGSHLKAEEIPALLDDEMPQQALVSAFRKYAK